MNFRNWSIFANLRWQRINRILHLDLQKERSILKASFIYSYIVLRMWKASPNNVCSQYFPGFHNSTSVWAQTVVSRIDPQIMLLFTKIVLDLITHFLITEEFQCKCQRQDSSLWPLSKYFSVLNSSNFRKGRVSFFEEECYDIYFARQKKIPYWNSLKPSRSPGSPRSSGLQVIRSSRSSRLSRFLKSRMR